MQINNITQPPVSPQIPAQPSLTVSPPPKREGLRSLFSLILFVVSACLIALLLITFVFQSYEVDGQSMESTLQHQDRLIIVKTGKTWASLWNDPYIPKRGEIIVFRQSNLSGFGGESDKQLIKRVIALPGERVTVNDGKLTVFNDEHPNGFDPDKDTDYGDKLPPTQGTVDRVVPAGSVFVMGDNRVNSKDSRDFGPVSADNIIGHLALRIFPLNKVDSF